MAGASVRIFSSSTGLIAHHMARIIMKGIFTVLLLMMVMEVVLGKRMEERGEVTIKTRKGLELKEPLLTYAAEISSLFEKKT